MLGKTFALILVLAIGVCGGYFGMKYFIPAHRNQLTSLSKISVPQTHQVIGFLPYWLISKADKNYSKYITTLTYFGLTIDVDGTILKYTSPGEAEPGWHTLNSGRVDEFLTKAKKNDLNLSLLIFSSDEATISALLTNPTLHAQNLVREVAPVMKEYGFTDLNIDIESVSVASEESRLKFTAFVSEVNKNIDEQNLGTLSLDVSPTALIKPYLINVTEISKIVDQVIFMTYDFHYSGSFVTGPVSPIGGAETDAEFDTETSIKEALRIMPLRKILVGIPTYGYEWETLGNTPRSAIMPGSGLSISNRRAEELIKLCASCTPQLDSEAKEAFVIYKDEKTGTYHQIFYPDEQATQDKIELTNKYKLGGLAVWALGYEGDAVLNPLEKYKNSSE